MVNLAAMGVGDSTLTRDESPGGVVGNRCLTQRRTPFAARQTLATRWDEDADHVVADRDNGNVLADRFDDPGRFMAEHHRQRPLAVTVDHRKIRVAATRCMDAAHPSHAESVLSLP